MLKLRKGVKQVRKYLLIPIFNLFRNRFLNIKKHIYKIKKYSSYKNIKEGNFKR